MRATDFTLNDADVTMAHARIVNGRVSSLARHEAAADRILLTLLALVLMLLAFFVVLTSASSVDQHRLHGVVRSVQATFERSTAETPFPETQAAQQHRAAVGVLRAAVADMFAQLISLNPNAWRDDDTESDRVEIDVPMAPFFVDDSAALSTSPVLDKIAAVAAVPPAGYRMEIIARAAVKSRDVALGQERVSALAMGLMQRGVPVTMLSVGMLDNLGDDEDRAPVLRFTFLLLEDADALAGVRAVTKPATAKAAP